MKNKKSGFTLGEVLLAVAIVGLIAALTIPNLNKNINEDKNISLLKSTMSQLSTAVSKVVAEYGNNENAAKSCGESKTAGQCYGDILTSFLNVRKNCTINVAECFSTEPMLDVDGETIDDIMNASSKCDYTFILSNGVAVCIRNPNYITGNVLGKFDIDVDGPNAGPNMRGVDNFDLVADEDGVSYFDRCTYYLEGFKVDKGCSRDTDRGYDSSYDSVAWAFLNGNMDYLRCADQLKWHSKKTCD